MSVSVQTQALDAGAELNAFTARVAGAGAIVTFTGVVRDVAGGAVVDRDQVVGAEEDVDRPK